MKIEIQDGKWSKMQGVFLRFVVVIFNQLTLTVGQAL
jgi:hypothetical protein